MGLPSASTVAILSTKVVIKVGLNVACPGAGSAVDFCEAIYDCSQGNYVSAGLNVASGVFDLASLGLWGAAKEAAQGTAKAAAVDAVKKTANEAEKKIGQEAAKSIAEGASKEATAAAAKTASKEATKKVGSQFAKELSMGMLGEAVEFGAYKATQKTLSDVLIIGSASGALQSGMFSLEEMVKNAFQKASQDSLMQILEQIPKETFTSCTAQAAKKKSFDLLKEEFCRMVIRDFAKDAAFGGVNFAHHQLRQQYGSEYSFTISLADMD